MNFDKEPGDIMVLEYCHEPKEGQGTPFEAFGTSLYFKKVSAQKVPNREIRGRLLLKKVHNSNSFLAVLLPPGTLR